MTVCEDHHYNCFFSKLTGLNVRFGKEVDDDPVCCELGPEILDLEVSVGGCPPVSGSSNCKYCYKNNTNRAPENMSFETFQKIIATFPINLSQIAFGITGLKTNPDLPKMLACCREVGIVPNLTTVGADMDDEALDTLCKHCGAVAVSCYTGAKELCYKTIKLIHDYAKSKYNREMHVNMHIVVSKDNMPHVRDVLKDIADKKVDGLKSVVLLRIKPCGRAKHMDCTVTKDMYKELVTFCLSNSISFGFDSCSATPVMEVLKEVGKPELCSCCEPCESTRLSYYVSQSGIGTPCSFCEKLYNVRGLNLLKITTVDDFINKWNIDPLLREFRYTKVEKSCQVYDLD